MKLIAIVGMTGSGKSESAKVFKEEGFPVIRFGDITDIELKERGIEINEKNEKFIREQLRKELGMDAYAKKNIPRIRKAFEKSEIVVIDGLYSWEEYLYLRKEFGDDLEILAIFAPPRMRYERLMKRPIRPLTIEQSIGRDVAEIENIRKAGPIAMSDYVINNIGDLKDLKEDIVDFLNKLDY
jgi:dephospho-CoA kinase